MLLTRTNCRLFLPPLVAIICMFILLVSCKEENKLPTSRSYRMGFQNSAPRYTDVNQVIQVLNTWVVSADAAMITTEVPWDSLLDGHDPVQYVKNNYVGLVQFYRQKNLKLWVYIDPANGLDRSKDSAPLVARNKSIVQADMQKHYRRFVVVMDSLLKPEHLGLALETNLIRLLSQDSVYQAVRIAANAAAVDIRAIDATVKLSISGQADIAWGWDGSGQTHYAGLSQDFVDFSFIEELGISSYPYFSVSKPSQLPLNYYSKLVEGKGFPVFVSEGGWTSQTLAGPSGTIISSPEIQRDYISRQSQMLDEAKAIAWFQLTFTDIDLTALPPNTNHVIQYFAYLGMLDANLQSRPSWGTWRSIFVRALN